MVFSPAPMASTKCSDGSSCSALRSFSSSSCSSSYTAMAADQMVKVEIEAAEALADLAALAVRESGAQPSDKKWRTKLKGKRARKDVKSESPTNDFLDSLPSRSDLDRRIEDRGVVSQQPSEKECTNQSRSDCETTRKMLKTEKEVELSKVSPKCTTSYPLFGCRKSRRNLTEAEKEERRVRRILANRESARQTIRRRQALCEELTKKAADLAWENENLKREKELALKEYHSLETTNKELKEQMAQAVKPKVEEIPGNNRSSHLQIPPLPTNYPLFLYGRPPFASYFWPSSPYQHELPNVVVIPSSIHLPTNSNVSDSSHVHENFTNSNGPSTPFCLLPCSWLLPHHDRRNQQGPQVSCSTGNNQEDICLNSQNSCHTSKVAVRAESRHSSLPSTEEKKEATDSTEALNPKNHIQNPVGVAVGGFETDAKAQVRRMISPVRFKCIESTSAVKQDNRSKDDHGLSTRACADFCVFPEKKHEAESVSSKKTIDAMVAAEARRRRKELTKLKNLHGRQCHMHS
ncbi:uncharacterized protein LOC111014317 isoform X2 [Momordica charantia]|uniref:Uncharacterized protein LOC111014317 isoform X2 n=1 Tax=Momordica charantia TaxID=3673 RepID=A0A6J1CU60_MOMCH|nr:uncharacterized protein LOC111014317 isoform X2 [Momordica charantia]